MPPPVSPDEFNALANWVKEIAQNLQTHGEVLQTILDECREMQALRREVAAHRAVVSIVLELAIPHLPASVQEAIDATLARASVRSDGSVTPEVLEAISEIGRGAA